MNMTAERNQFSDIEELEVPEYRPASKGAIVAWGCALLSWLALIHPLLLVIPILGAILAVTVYVRAMPEERLRWGKGKSVLAMLFCVVFGTWSISAAAYERKILSDQAHQFAVEWLELIREGKLYEAHQLTLTEDQRAEPGESLSDHYAIKERKFPEGGPKDGSMSDPKEMMAMMTPSPHELFRNFFSEAHPKRLSELAGNATYHFLRTVQVHNANTRDTLIKQLYGVDYSERGQRHRFVIGIVMERALDDRVANWRVSRIEEPRGN